MNPRQLGGGELIVVQRLEQTEHVVRVARHRLDGGAVDVEDDRLHALEIRRHTQDAAAEADVDGEVVAAELQCPRFVRRRLAVEGEVVLVDVAWE